jgi:HEAT repeat protein
MTRRCLWFVLLVVATSSLAYADETKSAANLLEEFSSNWDESAWIGGRRAYIRPLDDEGWQVRMRTLVRLSKAAGGAKEALFETAKNGELPERVLAAQALGYLGVDLPPKLLLELLREESNATVRLYLLDALGMAGGASDVSDALGQWRDQERNGDVRKHIGYALERGSKKVDPTILRTLRQYDPLKIATAQIGAAAPDFRLATVDGKPTRLSQFQGKQAVVLVFIYGDT